MTESLFTSPISSVKTNTRPSYISSGTRRLEPVPEYIKLENLSTRTACNQLNWMVLHKRAEPPIRMVVLLAKASFSNNLQSFETRDCKN